MAKRQPHMSAAPAYIVYGHRHAVRLLTPPRSPSDCCSPRSSTVFFGIVWQRRLRQHARGRRRHARRRRRTSPSSPRTGAARTTTAADKPAASSRRRRRSRKKHKPAKPIPPNAQIPVMVLNSNGIHGVAHTLAAQVQSAGYPITYVGNAQKRGLPTIVQYAKGYGPAARKLARLRRQRAVRDAARRHHAGAGRQRQARHHPRHVARALRRRRRWPR